MTFVEFKKLLDEKQLLIDDIAPLIGYSNDSINNCFIDINIFFL